MGAGHEKIKTLKLLVLPERMHEKLVMFDLSWKNMHQATLILILGEITAST